VDCGLSIGLCGMMASGSFSRTATATRERSHKTFYSSSCAVINLENAISSGRIPYGRASIAQGYMFRALPNQHLTLTLTLAHGMQVTSNETVNFLIK